LRGGFLEKPSIGQPDHQRLWQGFEIKGFEIVIYFLLMILILISNPF